MPQGLCVVYASLMWATRELELGFMFVGQMACEALNWGLKRWIKEERPKGMFPIPFLFFLKKKIKKFIPFPLL